MLLLLTAALAGDEVTGTVLAIEGPRFYTDLAAGEGLEPGTTVLLYRLIEVEHGGKALSDPFYLGEARVIEVGDELSLVQGDPALVLSVGVGDVVALEPIARPEPKEREQVKTSPGPSVEVRETVVEVVPQDVAEYAELMAQTQAPEARREALNGWLERWPESSLAPSVRALLDTPVLVDEAVAPLAVLARSASQVDEGSPLTVSVVVPDKARVGSAELFFRREGEASFRQRPMSANGDVSWVAEVPAESTVFPAVEWYVAVQDAEGKVHLSGEPQRVAVARELGTEGPSAGANDMAVRYEYVEFWWANPTLDRFHHGEAEYTYRMRYGPLHAFRVGYGAYSGDTGVVAELDAAETQGEAEGASEPIGFQYGYTELELRPLPVVGFSFRTTVGIDRGGLDGGLHGRVRFGHEEGTNLQLGAGRSWAVGDEYIVALAWNSVPRVPMLASVMVTNQPGISPSDYGVRLVYEPRIQIKPWLQMGLRVGYQLRNTNHLGPSIGGATVFTW